MDRPELPSSLDASVNCGPPGQPLVLSEEGPERARKLEWWAVSTAHTRGRVALRWSWVVRRPCDPEPPHAVKLGDLVWPSRSVRRSPSAPSSGQAGMSRRRRRKTRWRVPSWLQLRASRPRLGGGRSQWRHPPPLCKGPDRGRRVREQPPLFLEFMRALTPHFHWIAERERCGLWMVAKRVDLWLNRVFDTAEDFRLRGALPALLRALRTLHPDSWEACLHVNTSPIPRFMGGVEDAILDRGLGPVGTHQLLADLWDAVIPPFYREGLRDFDVEREWQVGERVIRGASRWVSQQVQRIVQALRGAGVYEETADPPPPPPTCYPFVIPKSSEKVSLILSCVKINKSDGAKPPTFRLDSWEDLARSLSAFPPDMGLYGLHIDLKNAFWSFCLPPGARQIFRFRPAPGAPTGGATPRVLGRQLPLPPPPPP